MLFSILKKISFKGKLDVIDSKNNIHAFGSLKPYAKIRFLNSSAERKILRNPSLYIGECYMNGEILIEEGTIEDFISIITSGYYGFLSNNLPFRLYENISSFFKSFHQINRIFNSKKNVAHHYDLNEDLFKLFLDSLDEERKTWSLDLQMHKDEKSFYKYKKSGVFIGLYENNIISLRLKVFFRNYS